MLVLLLGLFTSNCISINAKLLDDPTQAPAKIGHNVVIFPTPNEPPNVELLTKQLIQGKNVIKVNITSQSGIKDCKISYNKQGKIKTVDCVNDHDTVYKALIDAYPPFQTLQIYTCDINGDTTYSVGRLSVVPQSSILDLIWNSLSHLL